jgi:hypothetical protein
MVKQSIDWLTMMVTDMARAPVKALSSSVDGDNNKTKWSELMLHKKLKHVQQQYYIVPI